MSELFCNKCSKKFSKGIANCPEDGTQLVEYDPKDPIMKVFDERFKIIQKIGQGGMGTVYRAIQLSTGKNVAIKVISRVLSEKSNLIKRFKREVRLQSMLDHPNIVTVFDFSSTKDGEYYLVMGFIEGSSLKDFINKAGTLSYDLFFDIAIQLCDGIDYAHSKNIIHRDLKCDNVIICCFKSQNLVKILDFGLAKAIMEDSVTTSVLTEKGMLLGTPAYMPPEQAKGDFDKIGTHSDVYSLGIMFYNMLTSEFPFQANSPMEMIFKHIHDTPKSIKKYRKDVPSSIEKIIMKCLEKDPNKRYSSCAFIKEELLKISKNMHQSNIKISFTFFQKILVFSFSIINSVFLNSKKIILYLYSSLISSGFKIIEKIKYFFAFIIKYIRYKNIQKIFLIIFIFVVSFLFLRTAFNIFKDNIKKANTKIDVSNTTKKSSLAKQLVLNGGIKLNSIPLGASVKINNFPIQKTPAVFKDLAPGIYNVKVEMDGFYERELKVEVSSGKIVDGEVSLIKKKPIEVKELEITHSFDLIIGEKEASLVLENNNILKMNWVHAGYFDMGSNNGEYNEKPVHRVILSDGFFIGIHEVTQKEWNIIMGSKSNPSKFKGEDLPVDTVSFSECKKFISKINQSKSVISKGYTFRLPTEAEWEYSCRAGEEGNFHGANIEEIAWYEKNSGNQTHKVGTKKANAFGLYDMHGNVNEWCEDWYESYSSDTLENPKGPSEGIYKVRRGGPWNFPEYYLRSSYRYYKPEKYDYYGFRVVLSKVK